MLATHGSAIVPITWGDTSMVPHLYGGDAVWAVPLAAPPVAGELLLYRQQNYWVVHRCLGRVAGADGRPGFRTRGDGRNLLDPHLAAGDVLAKVGAVRRAGVWRSLDGPAARVYEKLMAAHDLAWAVAGVGFRKIGLGAAGSAVDRGLLRLAAPLVFPLCHRRIAPPTAPDPAKTV